MKKSEMIQINNAFITNEITSRYLEFYETIYETIYETYRCLFYLEGIRDVFGDNYKLKGFKYEYFIKDSIRFIQQKICLNIWKLLIDNENDSLSIYKMKGFIYNDLKYIVNVKGIVIASDLENRIKKMRNNFISHNLQSVVDVTVEIKELRPLLDNIYNYFQKLWIKNFVDDSLFISDGYFESLEKLYIESVKEAFKGIKL